jgi:hypothetical protein
VRQLHSHLSLRSIERQTEDEDMQSNVSEFPKYPLPHVPQPNEPQRPQVQQPTILVYERQGWEYEVVSRNVDQVPLSQGELNALGKDGWELVGVVAVPNTVQFYFKRMRR